MTSKDPDPTKDPKFQKVVQTFLTTKPAPHKKAASIKRTASKRKTAAKKTS